MRVDVVLPAVDASADYATYAGATWSAAQPMVIEQLTSVSCPSASFCAAVNDGNGWAPTYDGSGWPGGQPVSAEPNGQLRAVSCPSSIFCVTVDNAGNAVVYSTLPPLPPTPASSPPVSSSRPEISGSPVAGAMLTEAHGSWTNEPTSFSYQWERCRATGGHCSAITDATSQAYVISDADVGDTLRVQEVASDSSGPGSPAVSAPTAVVTSEATALSRAIVAPRPAATVKELLRRGGQSGTFHAPTAGHLEISWYADLHSAHRRRRVVIAQLSLRVPAGTVVVMLTLTRGDRHMLVHSQDITVVATGTFRPAGKRATTVTRRFKLKR